MGKMRYAAAILAMGLIAGALPLAAIEFGAEGCASDLFFPWVDTASSAAPSLSTWFWGGSAYVGLPIGDDAALKVTYERDRSSRAAAAPYQSPPRTARTSGLRVTREARRSGVRAPTGAS